MSNKKPELAPIGEHKHQLPSLDEMRHESGLDQVTEEQVDKAIAKAYLSELPTMVLEWIVASHGSRSLLPVIIAGFLRLLRKRWIGESTSALDDRKEKAARKITWGSFGKSGKEPMKVARLCDLETDHIENILILCVAPMDCRIVLLYILRRRYQEESLKNLLK